MAVLDTPSTSAQKAPPRSGFLTILVAGLIGGAACGLLDGFLATRGGSEITLPTRVHAAAIGAIAGWIAGIAVAVVAAIGTGLAHRGAPRWLIVAPAAIPAIGAFVALNRGLFQGAWVRAQWWAPIGEWSWLVGGSLTIVIVCLIILRLAATTGVVRVLVAILGAGIAVAAAWLDLTAFGAYPNLKWQFTAGAILGALSTARFLMPRDGLRWRKALLLTLAGAITASATAVVQRRQPTIHAVRASIMGAPLAVISHVIRPIERHWLAWFGNIAPIGQGNGVSVSDAELGLDSNVDQEAVSRELDARAPDRRQFNVVMIAIDALRADHLSCEGYPRPTTPRLDAFAMQSSWFRRCVSPIPASSMGYSSTMTGLYGRISPAYAAEFKVTFPVPDGFSLASRFKAASRRTLGVTAFYPAVAAQPQFAQLSDGFDHWNEVPRHDELRADDVNAQALKIIRSHSDGTPFFAFFHYMEPHAPYHFHPEHDFGRQPVDAYDSEIAYADAAVGKLLDEMSRDGLIDKTIIVIFGDHGEGFGEHNNREHGASLHDHQVRVPLLIKVPGFEPREIRQWVGLSDVAPTLLRLTGIKDPFRRLGRDLTPLMLGMTAAWPDYAYAERAASAAKQPRSWERAVWHGDLKLIWKPHHDTVEVYDVVKDPGETRNIYTPGDQAQERLFALLRGHDRLIDEYWEGPGSAAPTATLVERFSAAVDAVLDAKDDAAADKALAELMPLLNAPGVERRSTEKEKLGVEALGKLRAWLIGNIPRWNDGRLRTNGLRLLSFYDEPDLDDLLLTEVGKTRHGESMLEVCLALARHGREEVLPLLAAGFENGPMDARLRCAGGMAMLRDPRGRDLLLMGLDRSWNEILDGSIRGLAAIGDPAPLTTFLSSERHGWSHPRVERALVDVAAAMRTPTSTAVLLRLAGSQEPSVSEVASAELAKRLSKEELERARLTGEAFAGVANAMLYHDPRLALEFVSVLKPEDDPWVGYAWWTVFRLAARVGDNAAANAALDRLVAAAPEIPAARSCDAAARAAVASGAPRLSEPRLSVERAGDLVLPLAMRTQSYYIRVKVTNTGPIYALGGAWADAPRLGWSVKDPSGKDVPLPEQVRRYLPDAGLAPGASIETDVMGRLPDKSGPVMLQLALFPDEGSRPVLLGEPIAIEIQ